MVHNKTVLPRLQYSFIDWYAMNVFFKYKHKQELVLFVPQCPACSNE